MLQYDEGVRVRDMCEMLNCSAATLNGYVREYGAELDLQQGRDVLPRDSSVALALVRDLKHAGVTCGDIHAILKFINRQDGWEQIQRLNEHRQNIENKLRALWVELCLASSTSGSNAFTPMGSLPQLQQNMLQDLALLSALQRLFASCKNLESSVLCELLNGYLWCYNETGPKLLRRLQISGGTGYEIDLRHTAGGVSPMQVQIMLRQHDFYDRDWNPTADEQAHRFEHIYGRDKTLVRDLNTRCIWQKDGCEHVVGWNNGKQYVRKLNWMAYGGYTDWRLPTLEEVMSVMECHIDRSGVFLNPVFESSPMWIWTADNLQKDDTQRWVVYFTFGFCYYDHIDSDVYGVRAVRS